MLSEQHSPRSSERLDSSKNAGHFERHAVQEQIPSRHLENLKVSEISPEVSALNEEHAANLRDHQIVPLSREKQNLIFDSRNLDDERVGTAWSAATQLSSGKVVPRVIFPILLFYKPAFAALDVVYDVLNHSLFLPVDITDKERQELLPQKDGFTGLNNSVGTCYLNTTLQFITQVVGAIKEVGTDEEKKLLNVKISEHIPHLNKLNTAQLENYGDLQELYRQSSREVAKGSFLMQPPTANQVKSGFSIGGMGREWISNLLIQLKIPPVYFKTTSWSGTAYYHTRILSDDAIEHEFVDLQNGGDTVPAKMVGEIPPCFVRGGSKNQSNSLLKDVHFSHEDNAGGASTITFSPRAIVMEPRKHEFCCVKKDDSWYELNDRLILKIPKQWEKELESYSAQKGSMTLYVRKEKPREEDQLKEVNEENEENSNEFHRKIFGQIFDQMYEQIGSRFANALCQEMLKREQGLPFNSEVFQIAKETLLKMSLGSFFIKQAYDLL